jgi:type IV pilus assembly protein PilN
MRVSLNMATRPFADMRPTLKRLRIGMLVLLAVSGGAALGLHAVHQEAEAARARAHSLDGAIARVSTERASYVRMMQEPQNAQLLAETRTLNKLFDEKAFSWTLTIESLETVLPGGVQVSTLAPTRAADGHITLHIRVIGPRDKGIEFVRNLEHSRRFLMPRIVNESAENSNVPGQNLQPVSDTNRFSFDLQADYNPPSADEIKAAEGPGNRRVAGRSGQHVTPPHHGAMKRVTPPTAEGTPPGATRRPRPEYRRQEQAHPGQSSLPGGAQ